MTKVTRNATAIGGQIEYDPLSLCGIFKSLIVPC